MANAHHILQGAEEGGSNGSYDLGMAATHDIGFQVVVTGPEALKDTPLEATVAVLVSNDAHHYSRRGNIVVKGKGVAHDCKELVLPYKYVRLFVEKVTPGALVSVYLSQ